MPRGKTSSPSWVRIGHQSWQPGGGLSRSTKLSVGDAVTVSGKLTCLPSTMPIHAKNSGFRCPVSHRRIKYVASLRTLVLCNRRATSEMVSQHVFSESVHAAEV